MNECTEKDCKYNTKNKSNLKRHLWEVHNIGSGEIYNCSEKDCEYNTKNKSNLTKHLSGVHDIGDKQCEYCYSNVYSLIEYEDKKTKVKSNICRKCYKTNAGFNTRIEKEMVEFLKKDERISPYIVSEDKILKGNKCNTKRRPDLLISSTIDKYIIVECDENQHIGYDKKCEEGRINEILDELPDGCVSIIRWNPDKYKCDGKCKTKKERMEILKKLILKICETEYDDANLIFNYYCFYDKDNEVISNNWNKKFVYDVSDV